MDEENIYQQLVEAGYTEEQIQQIMDLGLFAPEQGINTRESELATRLREGKGPRGRYAGRVYVAANPLEHLAHVGELGFGAYRQRQLDERAREVAEEQVRARKEFLNPQNTGREQIFSNAEDAALPQTGQMAAGATPAPAPPAQQAAAASSASERASALRRLPTIPPKLHEPDIAPWPYRTHHALRPKPGERVPLQPWERDARTTARSRALRERPRIPMQELRPTRSYYEDVLGS